VTFIKIRSHRRNSQILTVSNKKILLNCKHVIKQTQNIYIILFTHIYPLFLGSVAGVALRTKFLIFAVPTTLLVSTCSRTRTYLSLHI
jgi:hypothetical protein